MKNKRGFTLVELLAVIVIISILAMLAIPNVTKRVEESRKKVFLEDSRTLLEAARVDFSSGKYTLVEGVEKVENKVTFSKAAIDTILEGKLGKSPFNSNYKDAGVMVVKTYGEDGTVYKYYVCLIDEDGNGLDYTETNSLSVDKILINKKDQSCTGLPTVKYNVDVNVVNGSVDVQSKQASIYESATFNVTPNSGYNAASVTCTNDQYGRVKNNVLTVFDITSDTMCTVTYSKSSTVLYNDGTLIINEKEDDRSANVSKHGNVIKSYPSMVNNDSYDFTASGARIPWVDEQDQITRIEIGQRISPTSTSKWFLNLKHVTYIDLTNLDFSNVTDTSRMFEYTGGDTGVNSFVVKGLDNADLSKVKNASKMFYFAGFNASTCSVGDLSNWNTSKMEDMSYLFASLCRNATSLDLGNLSTKTIDGEKRWDVSNVTAMNRMFSQIGQEVEHFKIKGISNWDVSNVTTMEAMFSQAGYHSKTWDVGNLSSWDTRKVTNMYYMFRYAGNGENAAWTSIGTLKVYADDISYMFDYTSHAKGILNIYSNPSNYNNAFHGAASAPDDSSVTVNYSSITTNIDNIIATKHNSDNRIYKGVKLD